MKHQECKKAKTGTVLAVTIGTGLLGLAFAAVVPFSAQEAVATDSQSGQVVTAYLEYQDVNYSYMNWEAPVGTSSGSVETGPGSSPVEVIRGKLQPGGRGSDVITFAWNRTARKLHLDLNRNRDLTDDEGGVFSSASLPEGSPDQTFTNIHVPVKTAAGSRQMVVDLSFYDKNSGPGCTVALRSFWQGKVNLQGKEWQVGLLGNSSNQRTPFERGNLLLRPWAERDQPFDLQRGSLTALPFPRRVFFGNRAYELQCTNEVQGDSLKVRLQFTEQRPKLGELKVTGDFVERVTMEGQPYLVVLDRPEGILKVPTGFYSGIKVYLKKGEAAAYLAAWMPDQASPVIVSDEGVGKLTAGGPLTNSAWVNRGGRYLWLNRRYLCLNRKLAGAGGEYEMVNPDTSHPPEFTVYQGDKKLVAGKFRFG